MFNNSINAHVQSRQSDKLQKGDVSGFLGNIMSNAVSITPPVFFASNTNLFQVGSHLLPPTGHVANYSAGFAW